MEDFGIAVFADKQVGKRTVNFLLEEHPDHVKYLVVVDEGSEILRLALDAGFDKNLIFLAGDCYREAVTNKMRQIDVDYILLAWWPFIIKEPILTLPRIGVLNFHPSLLPYNRGKHYNFWTIVEESPFGVSIHFVDESIDGGDIIFQKQIEKTWEDTGKTLYQKSEKAMFRLFVESYPRIVNADYVRVRQKRGEGSFHVAAELERASQVFLDKRYKAKDLLNLLRARTFPPHPACHFFDQGEKYEVRVEIKKVSK